MLPMNEGARSAWKDGHLLHEERVIHVPAIRLDSFMRREGIERVEFLKIDAQGADFAVLRSAGERLAHIDRIQLEVAVTPLQLYVGAAGKATIVEYLAARGFRLSGTEVQSHGQEENLTFENYAQRPHIDLPVASAPEIELAPGLYDFTRAVTSHGEVRLEDDTLAVVTTPQPWAYAAIVPLGAVDNATEADRFTLKLSAYVQAGAVQIGILNRDENDFPAAVTVGASSTWQEVTLVTPPLRRAGPLVIRNAATDAPSRASCRILSITRLPIPPEEAQTPPPALSAEEAGFLATQFAASAEALVLLDPSQFGSVAPSVQTAASRLRSLFASGGLALVSSQASDIEAIFAALDDTMLRGLASALAVLAPLRRVPGWRFGSFLEADDLATFIRYALWLALRGRGVVMVPWHANTRLRLQMGNDLSQAIFVGGHYEPNEFAVLEGVLHPGMTMIDAGANEGAYTIYAAARVGPVGRVMAIEPSPRELERLRANLELNNAANVTVVPAALAERPGHVELQIAEEAHAGQNTFGSFIYAGVGSSGRVSVTTTTIDLLVDEYGLDRVDVIKLDLEGAEERALRGARQTLHRFRPLLILEAAEASLARQGGSAAAVSSLLAEDGYRILKFDPSGRLVPQSGSSPRSDNLVAVHRDAQLQLPED
jgi:FkbM family methyltransferase